MAPKDAQLILVYNADSGLLNALIHAVHKAVRPETYECSLCAITYGAVSMRGEWRRFLDSLPMEKLFHHRDDFALAFPGHEIDLAAILWRENEREPEVLVSADDLDRVSSLEELIDLTIDRLAERRLKLAA
jgi:hypothetical protein